LPGGWLFHPRKNSPLFLGTTALNLVSSWIAFLLSLNETLI